MTPDELDARSTRAVESLDLMARVLPGVWRTRHHLRKYLRQCRAACGVTLAEWCAMGWREREDIVNRGRKSLTRRKNPYDRPDTWPPYFWEIPELPPDWD